MSENIGSHIFPAFISCLLGLVTFSALGGRYWGIAPSSITNLGSFARFSIPAKEAYATPKQRTMIEQMGRRYGCHTCKFVFKSGQNMRMYMTYSSSDPNNFCTIRWVPTHGIFRSK